MDRGAWRATVHSIAKSQTQLKLLSTHALSHFQLGTVDACGFVGSAGLRRRLPKETPLSRAVAQVLAVSEPQCTGLLFSHFGKNLRLL